MSRDSDPSDIARLEQLARFGRLAAAMLHDMSQPASMAMFLASVIERDVELVAKQSGAAADSLELRRLVDELRKSSKDLGVALGHLRAMLQRGKEIGRTRPVTLEHLDLNDVVEYACKLTRHSFDGQAELKQELGQLPAISGNFTELTRVLVNLLDNAARAVAGMDPMGVVTVRSFVSDGDVVLEVEDNGSGISPVISTRVFDPFFSTRGEDGVGLGLWVSSQIAEAHGGVLGFGETRESGALFRLSIPSACAEVAL
jgi:signal transduction histidine kinase